MKNEIFIERIRYMERILAYSKNNINDYKICMKFIGIFDSLYNEFVTKHLAEFNRGPKRKIIFSKNEQLMDQRKYIIISCIKYFKYTTTIFGIDGFVHANEKRYPGLMYYTKHAGLYPSNVSIELPVVMDSVLADDIKRWKSLPEIVSDDSDNKPDVNSIYNKINDELLFEYKIVKFLGYPDDIKNDVPADDKLPVKNVFTIDNLTSSGTVYALYPVDKYSNLIKLLRRLCSDDNSIDALSITLYRCGDNSSIINLIKMIADRNRMAVIHVYIELDAYGERDRNSKYVSDLSGYNNIIVMTHSANKIHAKMLLIKFNEGEYFSTLTYISTGNFNGSTATKYEDIGMLSTDSDLYYAALSYYNNITITGTNRLMMNIQSIGFDIKALNFLNASDTESSKIQLLYSTPGVFTSSVHDSFSNVIRCRILDETKRGEDGIITIKCNSITDPKIIKYLNKACDAGVNVTCYVRAECLFNHPKAKIISRIGEYLLHSRMYQFGGYDGVTMIGSADLNKNKLKNRHEVMISVASGDVYPIESKLDDLYNDSSNKWMDFVRFSQC